MAKKKKGKSRKRLLREKARYEELIKEHESKILENLKLSKRQESISGMKKEIKTFQREIDKISRLIGGKKKRKR